MKKRTLDERVSRLKSETGGAIALILGELNQGQRKKILKNEKVRALCERYGVSAE